MEGGAYLDHRDTCCLPGMWGERGNLRWVTVVVVGPGWAEITCPCLLVGFDHSDLPRSPWVIGKQG